jgi:hypothetical protein
MCTPSLSVGTPSMSVGQYMLGVLYYTQGVFRYGPLWGPAQTSDRAPTPDATSRVVRPCWSARVTTVHASVVGTLHTITVVVPGGAQEPNPQVNEK